MTSSQMLPPFSPFLPLGLREYIRLHAPCLDVKCFQSIPTDVEHNCVYNTRYGVDSLPNVDGWLNGWMHWCGRGAVLHRDVATYVNMFFIRWTEEESYAISLLLIERNGSELADAAPTTDGFECVRLPRPFDSLHLQTSFEYWWMEVQFEQRFCVRHHAELFVNWHCIDVFGIPIRSREKFFVRVPSGSSDYKANRSLVAPMPMVFAYH